MIYKTTNDQIEANVSLQKRLQHIDVAKGLGILMIVFSHIPFILHDRGLLNRVLFSFHVPLFFFLSGIFLTTRKGLNDFTSSRFHTLLIPYLSVSALYALYIFFSSHSLLAFGRVIANIIYASAGTIHWPPLWFLPHLFLILILSYLVIKFTTNNATILCITLISISIGTLILPFFAPLHIGALFHLKHHANASILGLPFSLDLALISTPYVIWGYLLSDRIKKMKTSFSLSIFAAIIFCAFHWFTNNRTDLFLRIYDNMFISTIEAGCGIYLTLSLSKLLEKNTFARAALSYVGKRSLSILLFQPLMGAFIQILGITPLDPNTLQQLLLTSCTIILCLILSEFARKTKFTSWAFSPR